MRTSRACHPPAEGSGQREFTPWRALLTGRSSRTGGSFCYDGHVVGRQIELVPGERLVQAWRFPVWEPGRYSIVRFSLVAENGGTRLILDQHGEPDDWHDHVDANWPTFYLTPLAEHFSAAVAG
jgi:activator of HSP90 ATPase